MNNGGIRSGLPAGEVSYAMLYEVDPFQNELVRVRLTGRQVRQMLEQALHSGAPYLHVSGIRVTWDPRTA